jgi:hypothetical protein
METGERQYHPGQIHASRLKRGSVIVAVDGPLRLRYRDESLSWLLALVPPVSVVLAEGEHHVLPYSAFVEIHTEGSTVVEGLVMEPRPWAWTWTSRLVALISNRPARSMS